MSELVCVGRQLDDGSWSQQTWVEACELGNYLELPDVQVIPNAVREPAKVDKVHNQGKDDLRPDRLSDFVGQQPVKDQLEIYILDALERGAAVPHTLLATRGGCGKTTLARIIANERGTRVYEVQCPVDILTLYELRETLTDGDVLLCDEIHMQVKGSGAATSPEILYHVMEDRAICGPDGEMLPFPEITVLGATTDEGLLPEPLLDRFVLRPVIQPYSVEDMAEIARRNAAALGVEISEDGAQVFAQASRGTPRVVNRYIKQAAVVARVLGDGTIDRAIADKVLRTELIERDGLTYEHMLYLRGLAGSANQRASLQTLSHAVGRPGDASYVQHKVEPILVQRGYVAIGSNGRTLTPQGTERLAA